MPFQEKGGQEGTQGKIEGSHLKIYFVERDPPGPPHTPTDKPESVQELKE